VYSTDTASFSLSPSSVRTKIKETSSSAELREQEMTLFLLVMPLLVTLISAKKGKATPVAGRGGP
jgi:hypothetical protein